MAAVLGMLAALAIGTSDLFGRRVVQASSALTAGATLQLFATAAVLVVAVGAGSPFQNDPFLWGGLSGLGIGAGIGLYYRGLEQSVSTVVAPTVASLSALLPFAYTAVRSEGVGPFQVVGALLTVVGLLLVTGGRSSWGRPGQSSGSSSGSRRRFEEVVRVGLWWGGLSGLAYAVGAIGFVQAADSEGWWPAVGQRLGAMSLLFSVAIAVRTSPLPPRGQWVNGALTGLINAATSLLYLAAVAIDPAIGIIAVSAFPAFSVLIGRVFFGDTVHPRQAAGIAAVIAGVAAVTVG